MSNVEESPVLDDIGEATEALETTETETTPEQAIAVSTAPRVTSVEEEGDIAADYLEELLDIADLDGDIDIEVRNGRTYISILAEDEESDELRRLVGHNGATLDALQELTRLAVLTARVTAHGLFWTSPAIARDVLESFSRSLRKPSRRRRKQGKQ